MMRVGRFVVFALVGVGFVLGLLVGASVRPSPTADAVAAAPAMTGTSTSPAAQSSEDPQPTSGGTTPTRHGAVEAAARIVSLLDGPAMFEPDARSRTIRSVAANGHAEQLSRRLGETTDLIIQQLDLSSGMWADAGFVWRAIPAGWRIDRYDEHRATVSVWGTGVVVVEGRQLDQPGWHTTVLDLTWEDGVWRLVDMNTTPGPTPPLPGSPDATEIGRVIAAFRPFVAVAPQADDA